MAFFFSSRRRHTRSKRDWSSDVCSSDLLNDPRTEAVDWCNYGLFLREAGFPTRLSYACLAKSEERSEERRVGKECRGGVRADHREGREGGSVVYLCNQKHVRCYYRHARA